MSRNETPISTEEYWELRSRLAEEALALERVRELDRLRGYMSTLVRVVGTVDHFTETVKESAKVMTAAIRGESNDAVQRLVEQYSLPDCPEGYEADLTGGPGGAKLRQKGGSADE